MWNFTQAVHRRVGWALSALQVLIADVEPILRIGGRQVPARNAGAVRALPHAFGLHTTDDGDDPG